MERPSTSTARIPPTLMSARDATRTHVVLSSVICVSTPPGPLVIEPLELDHDIVVFDGDGHRLGDIGTFDEVPPFFHGDREASHLDAVRLAIGLAGPHVELPAVPGTAQDLPLARILILAGRLGLHEPREPPAAQAAAEIDRERPRRNPSNQCA